MKSQSRLLAMAVILLAVSPVNGLSPLQNQAPQTAASPLTIALAAKSSRFTVGSPIPVEMVITNASKASVNLEVEALPRAEYYGYDFTLTLDGKDVPKTSFYKALRGEGGATDPEVPYDGSSATYVMPPGLVGHVPIDVRKLFMVTVPGSYLFSVEMEPNMDLKIPIHSQPLRLDIVQ